MAASVAIQVNEKLYLKNPEETTLGKNIVSEGIKMIKEIGFEHFNFKKLAKKINSTEASVYRYFENKHKFLLYIVSWYWSWIEYRISYETINIESPEARIRIALKILAEPAEEDPQFSHIDEKTLHDIVIAESSKSYLTKEVDEDNKEGFFLSYKSLCAKVATIVKEVDPEFAYPRALVSTVIEAAQHQKFFSSHLPSLTELKVAVRGNEEVYNYLEYLVFRALGKN